MGKIYDAVMGLVVGDALGVPAEFKARDTFRVDDMIGYGTYNQPPGTWSDDRVRRLLKWAAVIRGGVWWRMTREKMKSYRSARAEIKELKSKLKDQLIGNSENFVAGSATNDYSRKRERYSGRLDKLEKECDEIEQFIEGIEDSLTRRVFRMYYIDGRTQKEIAQLVNMDRSMVSRKLNTPDLC